MKELKNGLYTGERALFSSFGLKICSSVFEDGESPLKESHDIELCECSFRWKYPLWYCHDVTAVRCTLENTARSGIWYTHNIDMKDCRIDAPKTFRRSSGITLTDVMLSDAYETLWGCSDIRLHRVSVRGDYFGMNSTDVVADGLHIDGNYAFDGGRNITIRNATLISKDAFWNCENVTVYDSVIDGEYLGWNSKNVRFVNCTIESNQGMCYMDGVYLENCRLINTDLAFEYSNVYADIRSSVVSVKNPISGFVHAQSIGELIMEPERVDISRTEITVGEKYDEL